MQLMLGKMIRIAARRLVFLVKAASNIGHSRERHLQSACIIAAQEPVALKIANR